MSKQPPCNHANVYRHIDSTGKFLDRWSCVLEAFIRWQSENLPKLRWIDGNTVDRESYRMGYDDTIYDLRRMYLSPEPEVDRIDYYCKTGDGKYVLLGSAAPGEPFVHNTPPEPEGPVLGVRGERLRAELEKRHWAAPPTIGNTEIEADIAAFVEAVLLQVNPPQPSVPEEIADLMISSHGSCICESQLKDCRADCDRQNAQTLEAYRRGKTANQ